MFRDRLEAGEQLAERLVSLDIEADLVCGIPRGGLPVARPVARALGAPLDIVVAKKLGAPHNPEYAIGAAASDGSVYLDEAAIEATDADESYVEAERERATETAREKAETYRTGDPPTMEGKRVVIVDDGVATGATLTACLRMVHERGASRVVAAVPVGSPRALADLESEADELVTVMEPQQFSAVGQFYEQFGQVSDEEAMALLREE